MMLVMISEERFCNNINILRFAIFSGNENERPYCNIISNLQKHFPRDENGYCEIEQYCIFENFGKLHEPYKSEIDLYNELINKK
jgi:hypothetical protein